MRRAVFLDRDGTILNDRGYLSDPRKMVFYPTAFKGLAELQKAGFVLIIVSNQSGVGRGYFSLNALHKINGIFKKKLAQRGIRILDIYFCPHLPEADCACRKPKPGMILKAARKWKIDLKNSFVVGDQLRDVELARGVGSRGVLVLTGAGKYYREPVLKSHGKVAKNLETASRWIKRQSLTK